MFSVLLRKPRVWLYGRMDDLSAVWFLSIWPNTQEYRYTRRRSTFGFRPGEYSNTGIEILSI